MHSEKAVRHSYATEMFILDFSAAGKNSVEEAQKYIEDIKQKS